jgi:hypothetical protein
MSVIFAEKTALRLQLQPFEFILDLVLIEWGVWVQKTLIRHRPLQTGVST